MIALNSSPEHRPRVLLIAYQFPPVGGAGVQRVAKFAKYLPHHGWDVSVLTVANPSVPLTDASLLQEISADTVIRYAKTWEPSYAVKSALAGGSATQAAPSTTHPDLAVGRELWKKCKSLIKRTAASALQPDPQILWAPNAIAAGRRLLSEMPHDAIMASGPPFSSFLVAESLARTSGLPLILDYRDEWTISNRYWENKSNGPFARWVSRRLQARVLRRADRILATTERSAAALRDEVRQSGGRAEVDCLWNGFDPEDVERALASTVRQPAAAGAGRFRLSHIGTLWRLTSARPLLTAMEYVAAQRPDLASLLELELLGRATDAEQEVVSQFRRLPISLRQRDYVEHSAAVQAMVEADELCVLLTDVPEAERVMPAKCFEYLATGKPVLAIAPDGEMRRLLQSQPGVCVFAPADIVGIGRHLIKRLEQVAAASSNQSTADRFNSRLPASLSPAHRPAITHRRDLAVFDRRCQAGQLAELLADSRRSTASKR
jgi:glycosyltransferase involved in cell wall biosynthesis